MTFIFHFFHFFHFLFKFYLFTGMGKTAVFVLATMQQLEPVEGQVSVLVMCHTRELAFQISKEYERFSKYMSGIKVRIETLLTQ